MTRLELQLREAERAQERRGRASRALAAASAWAPSARAPAAWAAAAAVAIAAIIAAGPLGSGSDEQTSGQRDRSIVADVSLGDFPRAFATGGVSGFGDVWIGGSERGEVIRVNATTRRVVARVSLGDVAAGAGRLSGIGMTIDAVWAVVADARGQATLVRIDPATNRAAARIPLGRRASALAETNRFAGPGLLTTGRLTPGPNMVWVLGETGAARIDAFHETVADVLSWQLGDSYADSYALANRDLWVHANDGRLLRFDALTGVRQASFPGAPGKARIAAIAETGVLVGRDDGTLALIDHSTGQQRWHTGLEGSIGQIAIAGRVAWVLSEASRTERLFAVDLASGRVLRGIALGDPDSDYALAGVADELWVSTPDGKAVVVRPPRYAG